MRVIAGTLRGRQISSVPGTEVRPTTDRVREAMFNALFSLGVLDGAVVVDAFAGSGALGIEAISRGATQAVFIDTDQRALACVRANLTALGVEDHATIRRGDALAILPGVEADVVLADPPYAFEGWPELLAAVNAPLVVCESDREIDGGDGWSLVRSKRYGGTHITMLERT